MTERAQDLVCRALLTARSLDSYYSISTILMLDWIDHKRALYTSIVERRQGAQTIQAAHQERLPLLLYSLKKSLPCPCYRTGSCSSNGGRRPVHGGPLGPVGRSGGHKNEWCTRARGCTRGASRRSRSSDIHRRHRRRTHHRRTSTRILPGYGGPPFFRPRLRSCLQGYYPT
jgi:hypothetical protein